MNKIRKQLACLLFAAGTLCAMPGGYGAFAAETEPAQYLCGDVNCSGRMDVADAVLLARMFAEDSDITVTGQGLRNADADCNGYVEMADVTAILKMLAQLIPVPDGQPADPPAVQTTASTDAQTTAPASETTAAVQGALEPNRPLFEQALPDVRFVFGDDEIIETGEVNGQAYKITVNLKKWAQLTTMDQIVTLSELFWECYPRMYARFHDLSDAPSEVTLAIENEGYEVASAGGNFVHLHDNWLHRFGDDFDCITHELAHVIQAGWDSDYLEYSDYIERFADCCRYEYAMKNGYYNDSGWTLQTVQDESTREKSVRFLVWLDYYYSDENTDILRNYYRVCYGREYPTENWAAAWQEIFKGTALAGKSIDEVWLMFAQSGFAQYSSNAAPGETSPLLAHFPIREKLKK